MFSLFSLYFVSFVLFCFDFPLYFVFVGFSCIFFSISLCCSSLFVSCVFLVFIVLPIFSVSVSHSPSIVKPFFAPSLRRAFNASFNVRDILTRNRCLFSCIFIDSLLVISPVSIGLLLGVMFCQDLWVVDVSIILAFRSRMTSVGLGLSTPNVKK
jgi:hypothetical protein